MNILIAILSCHGNAGRRAAQRATWLRDSEGVDYRFFLGTSHAPDQEYVRPIRREVDEVLLACPDDYEHLRDKTFAMVRWAYAHGYEFVFKCDDDTFVRVDQLITSGFERYEYSGFMEERGPFCGCSMEPQPWAQGGAGYWLSRRAMEIVLDQLIDLRQEDTAVGRTLCAHGIVGHHDPRYQPEWDKAVMDADAITFHKADQERMRELHQVYAAQFAQL